MDALRRPSRPLTDQTLSLFAGGYAWLPRRMRESNPRVVTERAVRTRLMGRPALAVRGPEAVRFFYDERNVRRHDAIPEPVLDTLFGQDAVHTLDGEEHRERKRLFLPLLHADRIAGVVEEAAAAWDEAAAGWARRDRVVLFDEAAVVLTRGVCRWAGVPLAEADAETYAKTHADADAAATARDLIAMVDGFATLGPGHWRARRARARQEERLTRLVRDVRSGRAAAPAGSMLERVVRHRDADGESLPPRTAAVELLNVLRPTAAVSWFVAFAAHALHRRPETRAPLREGDAAYAAAFAHEVRRFYPFAPFLGGLAVRDLSWQGQPVPEGGMVLLDVYGQNHDADLWGDPYAFRPQRFLEHPAQRDELIPQGGGDPWTGHRCPGEGVVLGLLESLAVRLARLEYDVPGQDLRIPLRRVPARPRSGFVISGVHAPDRRTAVAVAAGGVAAGGVAAEDGGVARTGAGTRPAVHRGPHHPTRHPRTPRSAAMGHGGDVINELTTDHREVEEIFAQIEALPAGDKRRKNLADQATIELVRHSVAEEMYLYPAVRRWVPDGDTIADREIQDHAEAERTMKDLEGCRPDEARFDELMGRLMREIREHVTDEEQNLFPQLRQAATPEDLEQLGEKVRTAKKTAPTRPHPTAPDTPPANKLLAPGAGMVDRIRDALSGRGKTD